MDELTARRKARMYDVAVARLETLDMPEYIARAVISHLEAYSEAIADTAPEDSRLNPIELVDIETLGGGWVFSAEGVNYYRLALDEAVDPTQHTKLDERNYPDGLPEQVEIEDFIGNLYIAWMTENDEQIGGRPNHFSAALATATALLAYLMISSSKITTYIDETTRTLTFQFDLYDHYDHDIVRIDVYTDYWRSR